jgi:methionine-gamma-lyase
MYAFSPQDGLSTLVTHLGEAVDPSGAHIEPIYQTSAFLFPDAESAAQIFSRERPGYYYTRIANPNLEHLAAKIAALEGLDLLRSRPGSPVQDLVAGAVFASGMAAVTAAILAVAQAGDVVLAQEAIYSNTYTFLEALAPQMGIRVAWVREASPQAWQAAFQAHPQARLAYLESPVNPTLTLVDLAAVAEIAHRRGAWVIADNTFATPYCQRPLSLGVDAVVHSTTKYLSGHGALIGGVVVSRHPGWVSERLRRNLVFLGGSASPFDAWLANLGLKTFELRMERHCANALRLARLLETHPAVAAVYYPGLESHPAHALACRQMRAFGGMIAFDLKGGLPAGAALMGSLRLASLVASLGNVDTLVQHPASMTHARVPPEVRRRQGISDGLVRLSVGIENADDLLADLQQGLERLA